MKLFTALVLTASFFAIPAMAQTPAPAAPATPAPAAAPAPAASDLTKDGKPRMTAVRAQCQSEIQAQSLKGDARKQAMAACIVKARPDLAAAMKCRMDPQAKGLDKDARRAFVKDCVAKSKG
jgi:hypothetical protein